eukprot:scaffold40238_cov131-Skeletonema_marinoi.AAC.1
MFNSATNVELQDVTISVLGMVLVVVIVMEIGIIEVGTYRTVITTYLTYCYIEAYIDREKGSHRPLTAKRRGCILHPTSSLQVDYSNAQDNRTLAENVYR